MTGAPKDLSQSATNTPGTDSISDHDRKLIERYKVQLVPASRIKPSPENEEVYGPTDERHDPALQMLIRSIGRIGLEEPLILTKDDYILSGHRRFFALNKLGRQVIPVRYSNITRADTTDYHRLLAQYNPQRVKSVATVLSERLLEEQDTDAGMSWAEYHERRSNPEIKAMRVGGCKSVEDIGPRQQEFLAAAQKVIQTMNPYWPLTVRQVHYKLLNKPPLTQTTKDRSERWRYRNDVASYAKLCNLLVAARYHGHVPWEAIDDSTRESTVYDGYESLTDFVDREVESFLQPDHYHRHRQEGQPNHLEVLVEKNTLVNIVEDICGKFHVPFTPLRGYGGPSVWHEIEQRWLEHEKVGPHEPQLILIIISDHDPEGLNLADDAVRSLRDNHDADVQAIRPAVTMEQVKKYKLHPNPAKDTSSRYHEYIKRTRTKNCWECEALDPEVLRDALHTAILSAIDVDQLNAVQEAEAEEKKQLGAIKRRLGTRLQDVIREEGF